MDRTTARVVRSASMLLSALVVAPGPTAWAQAANAAPAPARIGRTLASVNELAGIWTSDSARIYYRTSLGAFDTKGVPTLMLQDSAGKGRGGVVFKVLPGERYSFHYDYSYQGCRVVREHEGSLGLGNGTLTMTPHRFSERQERVGSSGRACEPYENRSVPPMVYRMTVGEVTTIYGYATYRLTLTDARQDDRHPMMLDRLEPRPVPGGQPLPAGFRAGTATAAGDLQGLWLADDTSASTQGLPPEQRYRAALRLLPGGRYEFRAHRPDALHAPLCTQSVDLAEQGFARFNLRQELGGVQAGGTLVLEPTSSTLTEEVVRCGNDDHRRVVQLPLAPRYFAPFFLKMRNTVSGAHDTSDTVSLRCPRAPHEQGPWQFLFCEDIAMVFGYRRQ